LATDVIVAVKLIRINPDDEGVSSTTLREITILKKLTHQNIIKYTHSSYRLLNYKIDYETLDPKVELVF
jgi:serine/threonine protein kinase